MEGIDDASVGDLYSTGGQVRNLWCNLVNAFAMKKQCKYSISILSNRLI